MSLYLPAASGKAREAMLVHEGAPPIEELADLTAAGDLARRVEERWQISKGAGTEFLRSLDSASAGGKIVRVSTPETLLLHLDRATAGAARPAPMRRKSDRSLLESDAAPAIWMGFRMAEDSTVEWPSALDEPGSPASRWSWIFSLSATLAWHAQQVGTVFNDPVSRLPGRNQFQASLEQAIKHAKAGDEGLTLVLINPNDFGVVNENFGREAGDAVIREIADRLKASLRSSDLIGRYGGAVFSIGLLGTDPDIGRLVAAKLRHKLTEGAYLRGAVRLGFGFGLAAYASGSMVSTLELLRRADRALNLAKQSPEGRIVVWEGVPDSARAGTLDRLSGIFTANLAKDYRNMLLLWDTVNIVSQTADFEALATRVVDRLHATFKAERVALFGWTEEEGFRRVESGSLDGTRSGELSDDSVELEAEELALLDRSRISGDAEEARSAAEDGAGRFRCAVPLLGSERCLGCLYVEGNEDSETFDRSDLIFLKALAGQLAITLDRSLLATQERTRQERERRRMRSELNELRHALQEARLVYRSAEMETVVTLLRRLAPTDATLLITGESGTGKELLARTAHELSPRRKKPFVVVDCGAIAAPLIERELFGHEKGAYTSAERRGIGRLAEADGGTLILDEIGELPLEVQTRFLRFAQEKQFTPVGGTRTRKVDVRLIAVTNRDLEREVAAGRFRADLYYRLSVAPLHIPALRERPDDVVYLARHFLKRNSIQYQKGVHRLSPAAEARLVEYRWPGNVRELQNRIMRAVIVCEGEEIAADDLELATRRPGPEPLDQTSKAAPTIRSSPSDLAASRQKSGPSISQREAWDDLRLVLEERIEAALSDGTPMPLGRWLAQDLVMEANNATRGVMKRGAALLGIPATTFRRRLRKATAQIEGGLERRPSAWDATRPLIEGLVRATAEQVATDSPHPDILTRGRTVLLEEILERLPNDTAAGASFMGVTEPTFRRWASKLTTTA